MRRKPEQPAVSDEAGGFGGGWLQVPRWSADVVAVGRLLRPPLQRRLANAVSELMFDDDEYSS